MTSVSQNVDVVLDRQKMAWREGNRPSVEGLLRDSSLPQDSDVLLDLVYNEIVAREEIGEEPTLEEYINRYPLLEEDLRLQFEVHRAVQEDFLIDTRRMDNAESADDLNPEFPVQGPELTDYEIVGELGRGGMGVVYKARHRRLKRFVALKMFQPGRLPSPRERERFRAEAEAIARLHHGNIVQIFEVGEEHGLPFLALELAEKGTLQKKLQDLPYLPRAAAELIETLARAIQHAHEHHIIHRDLKPANVLFAFDGTSKITDFGLAKLLELDPGDIRDPSLIGEPIGTPRYMSPEQADGKTDQIGTASDVYALGTILYECLTGHVPFVSASVVDTVNRIRHEEPTPPRRLQRSIPRDLETICLNCLQKQPSRRYASAKALADDLRRFLNGLPIEARRTPHWERTWMWCRRRPALATMIAASFALICGIVIFFEFRRHQERERIALLRRDVANLVQQGQQLLEVGESREAAERFQDALSIVQTEPALADHELGVRGLLNQSRRPAERQLGRQRNSAPTLEERRDDAFIQSMFANVSRPESIRAAHQAIASAMEFFNVNDAALQLDREALFLLDADWKKREGDAEQALAVLDQANGLSTRLGHLRRAEYLNALGRKSESEGELTQASKLAPKIAMESLFRGLIHFQEEEFDAAIGDFDQALMSEPDYFLARFLQGASFLQAKRLGEAKVAFTACIGQNPRFALSYLLRALVHLRQGDVVAAAQDFQFASESRPNESTQGRINEAIEVFGATIALLPLERQEAIWNVTIITENGRQTLRDLAVFQKLKKS